jgi:hypothetical protein
MYTRLTFVYVVYKRTVNIRIVVRPRGAPLLTIYMLFRQLDPIQPLGTVVALPSDQTRNPNTEERKMRTDGQTIRGNETDMGKVKAWAKRTFSKERTSVVSCELVVAAYVGIVLAQVFLSY